MEWNRLYEKAFAFQSLKLWESLADTQIFAVQVNEQTCYISMMGMLNQHRALAVYPGKDALDGLWRIYQAISISDTEETAAGFGQQSLQCEFVPKEELEEEAMESLQMYADTHGLSLRKKNALWPQFLKYRPYRVPTLVYAAEDAELLSECLDAACWLAGQMGLKIRSLAFLHEENQTFPLIRRQGDTWTMEKLPMPPEPDIYYPIGHTPNEIFKARIKRLKKKGTWACKMTLFTVPCEAEGLEERVFPWELLTVDLDTGNTVEIQRVRDYETRTDVMLDKLMEAMFRENTCPEAIQVYDDRTYSLLEDWTAEMGIELSMEEDLPYELERLEVLRMMESDPEATVNGMEQMLDELLSMSDRQLFLYQPELALYMETFFEMIHEPDLPETLRDKISTLLARYAAFSAGKSGKAEKKSAIPEKSLVISVSYDTGCYRHIQISNQATLADLSDTILDAFDFDNDHGHGFFLDNKVYSHVAAYFVRGMEEDNPSTDEVSLAEVCLQAGQKFKYLFDFGDDWTFQCKVLKELDEITAGPMIVRIKGQPPEQYQNWDGEDDWDVEDDD